MAHLDEINLKCDVGFGFIKPDYIYIADELYCDFLDHGLKVIHSKELKLPADIIDYIYSDSRGEHFYEKMCETLGRQAVIAMLITKECSNNCANTVQLTLECLKRGMNGYPNLRVKYQRRDLLVTDEEFELWKAGQLNETDYIDVTFRLTQGNVFHAADGPHDAIGSLLRLRYCGSFFDDNVQNEQIHLITTQLDRIIKRRQEEVNMTNIKRVWSVIDEMPNNSLGLPIRQVYAWVLTSDDHVVIVSKDGKNWQLPGGKPEAEENALQAVIREVKEETNIDISSSDAVKFFGEYIIYSSDKRTRESSYRQVRSYVRLPQKVSELILSTSGELHGRHPEDAVRFVSAVPVKDILCYIKWMDEADEYKALQRNGVIERSSSNYKIQG